jgi:hypothetical protein
MGERANALASGACVPESVAIWRVQRLRDAGVPLRLAWLVASDGRYDVHALIDLIEHGCPPECGARIVAPLDDRGPR